MKLYEVKAWVVLWAENERDAYERAGALLDTCVRPGATLLEGRDAVYEVYDAVLEGAVEE